LVAGRRDRCEGNSLIIYGQAEGDGSLICGSLDKYESEELNSLLKCETYASL